MSLAPVRKPGPLGELQSVSDVLKRKVDELNAITTKWSPKSADDPQVRTCHASCVQYKVEASSLLLKANNLQLHNEPNLPANFDQKKEDEIKRLQSLQLRINRILENMEQLPNGDELRKTQKQEEQEDTNVSNEEQDSEEEEDNDFDEEVESDGEDADLFIAIHDFAGEQDGDLPIKVDEILDVLVKRDDGWWEAEKEDGKRGLVPSNFLKKYEDDDEESSIADKNDTLLPSELDLTKPDSEVDESVKTDTAQRSGKELWMGIKEAVNEPKKMDVTDVLAAMGALPSGFRASTLLNLLNSGPDHSLRTALLPTLTDSNLCYRDLHWEATLNQLRSTITRVLRSCKIWKCVMIPEAGTGVEVLSHHIRYALFDGLKVISNIQTLRASVAETNPKTWQFSSAKDKEGGYLPTLLDGYSIVRTDHLHTNLGILFELSLTYIRSPPKRVVRYSDGLACEYSDDEDDSARMQLRQTGERGELSCGWAHLQLFDEQGNPVPNKTYELRLNGGTPFERGVAVDPSITRRATTNRFRALLASNKQPRLMVQLGTPSPAKRKYLDLLPSTIVAPIGYCELISIHRRLLVDALVYERANAYDGSLVHSPVIAAFLDAVEQPDIMDAVKRNWLEKARLFSRADKRDKENLKSVFKTVIMETAYPLLHLKSLPTPRWADHQVEAARSQLISQTVLQTKQTDGVLRHFLSANTETEPFDISELTFDPLRSYARVI